MEKSGIFSLIKLNDRESDAFLDYLRKSSNTPVYDLLNYVAGDDYLKVLDLMAGMLIKIPSRKNLYRDVEQIKIYCYVRDRGFTLEALQSASKIYSKRMAFVRRSVERISNIVDGSPVTIINKEKEIL